MTQTELLHRIVVAFGELDLQYMLVGSFASSVHGQRRDTDDIDVVIALPEESISSLSRLLPEEDFYLDQESAREAIIGHDMFNIIHCDSGLKVDLWMLKNDEFAQTQFARKMPAEIWGIRTWVESPEDTILSKLLWNKISASHRQIADIRGIITLNRDRLDWNYINTWAAKLEVDDVLRTLSQEETCQEHHS